MSYDSQVFLGDKIDNGLNIGCQLVGTCFREPYINLDFNVKRYLENWQTKMHDGTKPIYFTVADATKLPFRDEVFDEVYSSHLLEHFNFGFTIPILREWFRVLRVGGKIKVCVPDFEWDVKLYRGEVKYKNYVSKGLLCYMDDGTLVGRNAPIFAGVYGNTSNTDSQVIDHKMIFDKKLFEWILPLAGFKNVANAKMKCCPYPDIRGGDLCVVATK